MDLSSLFSALSLISVYIYLHIGIYTLKQNKASLLNRVFLLLCISFATWSFAYSFAYVSEDYHIFSLWNKLSAFGWCSFSALSLYLVLLLTENQISRSKIVTILIFSPAVFFLSLALFFFGPDIKTPSYISTVFYVGDFLYNFLYLSISIALLVRWGIKTDRLRVKKQAKLLVVSSVVPFILNLFSQWILPLIGYRQFPLMGQLYAVIMILGTYFVITRYKMFHIPENIVLKEVEKKIIEMVITLNESGQFVNVSKHTLTLLGYEGIDLIGKNITCLFEDQDKEKFSLEMLKREIEYNDIQIYKKNTEKLPVHIICVPITDEIIHDFLGSLLIIRDISKEHELRSKNAELHDRTIRDSLTNLYNHQHSLELLNMEVDQHKEDGGKHELTIMMLDIDYFKHINDTYGHLYGDYVIRTISAILLHNVKHLGHAGRFGGEEFLIILPRTGINEAYYIGEKIRNDIAQYKYKETTRVTISIGIAQLGEETPMQLLKKSDDLLYVAKNNGRNRMEFEV